MKRCLLTSRSMRCNAREKTRTSRTASLLSPAHTTAKSTSNGTTAPERRRMPHTTARATSRGSSSRAGTTSRGSSSRAGATSRGSSSRGSSSRAGCLPQRHNGAGATSRGSSSRAGATSCGRLDTLPQHLAQQLPGLPGLRALLAGADRGAQQLQDLLGLRALSDGFLQRIDLAALKE